VEEEVWHSRTERNTVGVHSGRTGIHSIKNFLSSPGIYSITEKEGEKGKWKLRY
jgi:hypothetical protein